MKTRLRLFSVFSISMILGAALPLSAHAGFLFVEPYVGYGLGGGMSLTAAGTSLDLLNYKGIGLGARAGFHLGVVFVGADYSYYPTLATSYPNGAASVAFGTATYNGENDKLSRLGAVLGVNIPVLPIRAWVGYNPMEKLGDNTLTLNGRSFKAGLGLTPLPFISLNVEYILSTYTSSTADGVSQDIDSSASLTSKMILVSASVPLSF